MSNVCVCVCVSDRGRSHSSTRQGSGHTSRSMGQRYGCTDVVFCSTFLQHLGAYTTIAKRISRILGPFLGPLLGPFAETLPTAFRLHRSHDHRRSLISANPPPSQPRSPPRPSRLLDASPRVVAAEGSGLIDLHLHAQACERARKAACVDAKADAAAAASVTPPRGRSAEQEPSIE